MLKTRILKTIVFVIGVSILGINLGALPDYLKIYAADPSSRPDLRTSCATCHVNAIGGGPRNAFGNAFAAAGLKITNDLRKRFPDHFNLSDTQSVSLPVTFVKDSDYQAIVEMGGKKYIIDTQTRTVKELVAETKLAVVAPIDKNKPKTNAPEEETAYHQMDVRLIGLPTAKPIAKGALIGDFTHRFPFGDFTPTDAGGLFGLDGYAIPSFGFAYGITDRIHVGAYRSPDAAGRPILVYAGVSLLDENKKHPFTAMAHVGIEGRDNFQRNFTTSLDLTIARSITNKAQLYFVPTVSFNNRKFGAASRNFPGANTFAIGVGGALNIRPTVALLAEANWRVNEAGKLGSNEPVYGFGIEKETISRRHAFSLVFSNGAGTTFAQRSAVRSAISGPGSENSLSIGFNLSRRIF